MRTLLALCLVLGSSCAHSLRRDHTPLVASSAQALSAPTPAPFDFKTDKACQNYDACYLICSTATPILAGLASSAAGLPVLVPEMPERSKAPLLLSAVIAGALATGTAVCARDCAARFTDRCTAE